MNNMGHTTGSWAILPSGVHGEGVHVTRHFRRGEIIDVAIEKALGFLPYVTFFGGKVNHSLRPNCELWFNDDKWYLRTLRDLRAGEEALADYNNTPWFIMKPDPSWT